MGLTGRVALVTGGGRGIGRASALALAGAGADVAVAARTESELKAVAAEIEALGRRALALVCDVTRYADCAAAVERTRAELGRLDILVANAGGSFDRRTVLEDDPERWAATITLNLVGTHNTCRAALPALIEAGGGKIIVVGSGRGRAAQPGNSSYSASKAGVWMFTQCLAMEVWQHGIDVNEVGPGPVDTRLLQSGNQPGQPMRLARSERLKPPDEVADLVLWLAERPAGGPTAQSFSLARRPL